MKNLKAEIEAFMAVHARLAQARAALDASDIEKRESEDDGAKMCALFFERDNAFADLISTPAPRAAELNLKFGWLEELVEVEEVIGDFDDGRVRSLLRSCRRDFERIALSLSNEARQ